jgi:hypothetical protein
MSILNDVQKLLVFDYCLRIASQGEAAQAEALISSSQEASELYQTLRATLAPLDTIEEQSCPDELAERTIVRISGLTDSGQIKLEQLIAAEQKQPTIKIHFWHNLGQMAAAAAVIIFLAGILIPSLGLARQRYWQQRCQMQLGNIFQGVTRYASDYDGKLSAVIARPDTPWCRVGYQGQEDYSNTRSLWRLVKGGYVKNPADFQCPGRIRGRVLQIDIMAVRNSNDFPDRRYVTYSPRIICTKGANGFSLAQQPLMSDLNPIFENLPQESTFEINLRINDKLLTINSPNHGGRGQNLLFGNGKVQFIKVRRIDNTDDDFFTLQEMQPGSKVTGCEVPSCDTDVILAP